MAPPPPCCGGVGCCADLEDPATCHAVTMRGALRLNTRKPAPRWALNGPGRSSAAATRPGRRPRPPAPAAVTAAWSNPSCHLLPTPRCPGRAGRPKVLDMRRPRARSGLPGGPGLPMVEGAASDGPGRRRREAAARHLFARLHRGPAGLGDLGDPS